MVTSRLSLADRLVLRDIVSIAIYAMAADRRGEIKIPKHLIPNDGQWTRAVSALELDTMLAERSA